MQSLLRWSLENSTSPDGTVARPQQPLDPGIIDTILGRPDSALMKEALDVAMDENRSVDDRVNALEEFETLIQSIDNANNLSVLGMWGPLFTLLTSPTSPPSVKFHVLWIIGTALQNNPAAQSAYLALEDSDRPLSTLLGFLNPATHEASTRSKAVYALSGLLKLHAAAVNALGRSKGWTWAAETAGRDDGWAVLGSALKDPDARVRRKVAFLLNSLLLPSVDTSPEALATKDSDVVHPNSHASMVANPESSATSTATMAALGADDGSLIKLIFEVLSSSDPDLGENLARLLHTYAVHCQGRLTAAERGRLRDFLEEMKEGLAGLDVKEYEALQERSARV